MNTKLTLTIEKDVIEQAKEYAGKQGQSLSSLVENYFKLLLLEKNKDPNMRERKPLPESFMKLKGCLKHEGEFDYKEELTKALEEKYGL
jgi:hypothetical protein